jgi:DNA-directed RNA polymerase subunit H (RpoH/RPB5)/predicted transposase YbfD/YdcC
MSTTSNLILTIYKARKTILEILEENQEYNTSDYRDFSINEIDAMYANNQLDMLLTHNTEDKKIYIKYYLAAKQIKPQNLDDVIEDLFSIENILTKNDTLMIIVEDEPNDTIHTKMKYLYDHDGIFVIIHNIKRLQFNILKHRLVPECKVLNKKEIEDIMKQYNIKDAKQFPEISRFDPQALAMCLRPGDICKFQRDSATAMKYNYYRVCV